MPIREENQQKCVSNGSELDITTPPPDYYTLFPNPVLVQNSREPPNSQPNATFILITPNENRPDNHNVQNEVTINRSQSYAPAHSRGNVSCNISSSSMCIYVDSNANCRPATNRYNIRRRFCRHCMHLMYFLRNVLYHRCNSKFPSPKMSYL
ncbi:uncharacterized protein LOC116349648 isoform X1 [Contarinia nasturtii]|uniref:uncharacterized protein LOC116349648 isoform X1 n=1 Tax=Contarinia nasturtii TaxID=265458 RepID=UPI0012D4028F|nr:uncharacterized protein LOC116349648 isoform X1 [Contarinia nasturtii]XP_031637044.1 uncharacterized protein LOC116349648 isoform X1 [Contarinia nasturtii]XP_031637045.1 uncharacterized protein LOC116349648 isoform X1 [Contarinia nasturtii]XP_031637046.1 uncharacterized protein LOC116349648 isoform X1 [Contarinia nasturtii]XP_031637047.1 uncharacterized protein LOC116349648 isoform X1 [Contarinia nasturtii]